MQCFRAGNCLSGVWKLCNKVLFDLFMFIFIFDNNLFKGFAMPTNLAFYGNSHMSDISTTSKARACCSNALHWAFENAIYCLSKYLFWNPLVNHRSEKNNRTDLSSDQKTNRPTDQHTDTDRQTETDRQTNGKTDRPSDHQTNIQTQTNIQ